MATDNTSRRAWLKLALVMLLGLGAGVALFVATLRSPSDDAQHTAAGNQAGVLGLSGLFDQSGEVFDAATLQSHYALVYFGFTACPDACPTALYNATLALQQLDPDAGRIQPIFVTVDPARDTPVQLSAYLGNFSSTWLGLTGAPDQLKAVEQRFGVIAIEHRDDSLPGGYTMDHSNEFLLFSPGGKLLMRIPANQSVDMLLEQLRSLTVAQTV